MSDCDMCRGYQEAEQNPDVICDFCASCQEEDFLVGKTCNPDAPEECESCQ